MCMHDRRRVLFQGSSQCSQCPKVDSSSYMNKRAGDASGLRFFREPDAVFGVSLFEQDEKREFVVLLKQSFCPLQHNVLSSGESTGRNDMS